MTGTTIITFNHFSTNDLHSGILWNRFFPVCRNRIKIRFNHSIFCKLQAIVITPPFPPFQDFLVYQFMVRTIIQYRYQIIGRAFKNSKIPNQSWTAFLKNVLRNFTNLDRISSFWNQFKVDSYLTIYHWIPQVIDFRNFKTLMTFYPPLCFLGIILYISKTKTRGLNTMCCGINGPLIINPALPYFV